MTERITMELTATEADIIRAYRKAGSTERLLFKVALDRILGSDAAQQIKRIPATEDPEQTRIIQFEGRHSR